MTSSTTQNLKAGYNSSEEPTNNSKSAHFDPRQSKGSECDWLRWRHLKLDKWGLMTGPRYFTSEIPLLFMRPSPKTEDTDDKVGQTSVHVPSAVHSLSLSKTDPTAASLHFRAFHLYTLSCHCFSFWFWA